MHRSGTSAVTRALSLLGAELPKNLLLANPSNEAGHWEPIRLVYLHERIFADAGTRWDDWRSFASASLGSDRLARYKDEIKDIILQEYGSAALLVLKDPRICRLVPLYQEIMSELQIACRYVLPHRNPLAVVASLSERDRMTPSFAGLLWLRHVLDSEAATRGAPRVFVSYEAFLADWRNQVRRIGEALGLEWTRRPEATEEIGRHLSQGLQHHRKELADLRSDPKVPTWIKITYSALLRLSDDSRETEALAILDRVGAEFGTFAPIFGEAVFPELAVREQELASLHSGLADADRRLDAARRLHEEAFANANEALANANSRVEILEEGLGRLSEALTRSQQEKHNLRATIDRLRQSISWRITKPVRWIGRLGNILAMRTSKLKPVESGAVLQGRDRIPQSVSTTPAEKSGSNLVHLRQRRTPLVSIVIPVKNGMPHFRRVIEAVSRQDLAEGFEVIVIDSGSTDGSKDVIPTDDPRFRLIEIASSSFGHGRTRNLGAREATGLFCAFLTHDAEPANPFWLRELIKPLLQDDQVAGVFGRHVAYEEATPFTAWELDTHFAGLKQWPKVWITDAREYSRNERLRQVFHYYSDNSSCLRKSVWEQFPYPDVEFAEDQLWAKQIVEAGFRKAFAWDSLVRHSHDYSLWERVQRSYDEA